MNETPGAVLLGEFRRRAAGRGQREVARELGITQASVSRVLAGDQAVSPYIAQRMARAWPELTMQVVTFMLTAELGPRGLTMARAC